MVKMQKKRGKYLEWNKTISDCTTANYTTLIYNKYARTQALSQQKITSTFFKFNYNGLKELPNENISVVEVCYELHTNIVWLRLRKMENGHVSVINDGGKLVLCTWGDSGYLVVWTLSRI